jgi:hypothetical protein
MRLDEQVEARLRKAYSAAIAKKADDVTAALAGITNEQSITMIGLGLYVAGYIVNDIHRDGVTDEKVRALATEIVNGESDWMDLGEVEPVARFLRAAAQGDVETITRLGPEDATGLVIVAGAHLLAYYRQEGERWHSYLDAILDNYEAAEAT